MLRPHSLARAAGLGVLLLTAACSQSEGSQPGGGQRPEAKATPVAVVEVRPRDLTRSVTVTGPLLPLRKVLVSAQTSGTITELLVEEGDRVRAEQLLARLDAREASAQLERARAVLASAEAAYQRTEQLSQRELSSASEIDAARASYEIAKADVELWQTRVAFCSITAPIGGVVSAKSVERGSAVSGNQTMFEIDDDSQLLVRARLSELDVVHLSPGTAVPIQLDAYPDASLRGTIRRIFPAADANSRLVPVEVVLGEIPPAVEARPGFLARLEFTLERRNGVLAVPSAALGAADEGSFVYVVEASTLSRRVVETGLTTAGWVEIRDGLTAREQVVSSGHVNLRDGLSVRVHGENADE